MFTEKLIEKLDGREQKLLGIEATAQQTLQAAQEARAAWDNDASTLMLAQAMNGDETAAQRRAELSEKEAAAEDMRYLLSGVTQAIAALGSPRNALERYQLWVNRGKAITDHDHYQRTMGLTHNKAFIQTLDERDKIIAALERRMADFNIKSLLNREAKVVEKLRAEAEQKAADYEERAEALPPLVGSY